MMELKSDPPNLGFWAPALTFLQVRPNASQQIELCDLWLMNYPESYGIIDQVLFNDWRQRLHSTLLAQTTEQITAAVSLSFIFLWLYSGTKGSRNTPVLLFAYFHRGSPTPPPQEHVLFVIHKRAGG